MVTNFFVTNTSVLFEFFPLLKCRRCTFRGTRGKEQVYGKAGSAGAMEIGGDGHGMGPRSTLSVCAVTKH